MLPDQLTITGTVSGWPHDPSVDVFEATFAGSPAHFVRSTGPATHLGRTRRRLRARRLPFHGWVKVLAASDPEEPAPWLVLDHPPGLGLAAWLRSCASDPHRANAGLAVAVVAHLASLVQACRDRGDDLPGGLITDAVIDGRGDVLLGYVGSLAPLEAPSEAAHTRHLLGLLDRLAGPQRPRALSVLAIELEERPTLDALTQALGRLQERHANQLALPEGTVDAVRERIVSPFDRFEALRRDQRVWGPSEQEDLPTPPTELAPHPLRTPDLPPRTFQDALEEVDISASVVGGRYRLQRPIGSGAMGHVYEAIDEIAPDGPRVAVKVTRPDLEEPEARKEYVVRFRREADVLSRLHHPHVVEVFGFGSRGACWIAMELVPGHSLVELLDPGEPLPIGLALEIGRQVADALAYAHGRGIIHRDIKPGNLLVARQHPVHIKLCDFGLAKAWDDQEHTVQGALIGTPQYMSPEQAQGLPADNRSDIYGLGILLYRMLSGRTPFAEHSGPTVLLAHSGLEPAPLVEANPKVEVPPIVQEVVDRCLAKDPDERYGAADLLEEDLKRCIDRLATPGDPTPALSFPYREHPTQEGKDPHPVPMPPQRPVWPLAVAGLVALAVGVALAWWLLGSGLTTMAPPTP